MLESRKANRRSARWQALLALLAVASAGCGTTRWSDTSRTATEQMLVSDAVDRAISQIDFSPLAGRTVFLDNRFIVGEVDDRYLYSTLRQHMLASGAVIKEKIEEADIVVETRSGALGTNRSDLLFGIPATNLPTGGAMTGIPSSIPEISFIKRTGQTGVCKVSVFAYHRATGQPVWQSGAHQVVSKAKDVWIFGAGPFQRGSIYNGTRFDGDHMHIPLSKQEKADIPRVCQEIRFPAPLADANLAAGATAGAVNQASHTTAAPDAPNGSPPPTSGAAPGEGGGAPSGGANRPPVPGSQLNAPLGSTNKFGALGSQNWEAGPMAAGSSATSSANPLSGAIGAVGAYKQTKSVLSTDRGLSQSATATSTTAASATTTSETTTK